MYQRGLVDEGDLVGQRGLIDLRVEGGGCRRGKVIGPSSFGGGPSRVGRPKRVWVPSRVGRPMRVCGVDQAELVNQRGFWGGPSRVGRPRRVCGVDQAELVDQTVGRPRRVCGVDQAELVDQGGFVGWTRQSW